MHARYLRVRPKYRDAIILVVDDNEPACRYRSGSTILHRVLDRLEGRDRIRQAPSYAFYNRYSYNPL